MEKELAVQLLERFRSSLENSKKQKNIQEVLQELDLILEDILSNDLEGIALPIILSEFTNKINLALAFDVVRFSEEQSRVWKILQDGVIKRR